VRAIALLLGGFGGLTLLLALSRWLARRRWAALGHLALAGALLAAASTLWPLAADLASYGRLRPNAPLAQVFAERTGSKSWRLTLTRLPEGRMQVFEVTGEEWRLDAHVLRWKGRAIAWGATPAVRLERLSTRFAAASAPGDAPASSYALTEAAGGDLWERARGGSRWADYVEAQAAEGEWRRLAPGGRWEVRLEGPRLQSRPANAAAQSPPAR